MKTLKDHVLLYDAVCPLCNLYTKGFIQSGMLEESGRMPYQELPSGFCCSIDRERFVDEIALVNPKTGQVFYGIESLFRVIGHAFPVFQPLFRCRPFVWVMDRLYKFVSYNRRVIMPARQDQWTGVGHQPSFNKPYRLAFLVFTWMVTAFILYKYSLRLNAIFPHSNYYREFLVCGGQILWQLAAVRLLDKPKTWDYLGNMMTISFGGSLLLLLMMLIGKTFHWQNPYLFAGFFGGVVLLMLLEHVRRMKLLQLSPLATLSWVLYRIIVLIILFIPFYV